MEYSSFMPMFPSLSMGTFSGYHQVHHQNSHPYGGIHTGYPPYFWHPADHAYLFSAYLARVQAFRNLPKQPSSTVGIKVVEEVLTDSREVVEAEPDSTTCSCSGTCRWQHLPHRKRRCAFPLASPNPTSSITSRPGSPASSMRSLKSPRCESPDGSHDSGVWSAASSPVDFSRVSGQDTFGDTPFRCLQCAKPFHSGSRLRAHQRRHVSKDSGKYSCLICSKSFVQRSSLTTHQRIHSGEKPFTCPDCPERFGDFSTFTKHKRTHTGEKPYACPVCGRTFSQSGNMHRHVKAVHDTLLPFCKDDTVAVKLIQ